MNDMNDMNDTNDTTPDEILNHAQECWEDDRLDPAVGAVINYLRAVIAALPGLGETPVACPGGAA